MYLGPTISNKNNIQNKSSDCFDKDKLYNERMELYFSKIKDACYQGGTYDLFNVY